VATDIERLCFFYGAADPETIADSFYCAKAILPLPGKADVVLRVNGQRDRLREIV
jgi:hypothetical protein